MIGRAALQTIFLAVNWIVDLIWWFILVWVVISWIVFFTSQTSFRTRQRTAFNILVQLNDFFTRATNPILRPFRRLLPPWKTGGIDWSPILLLFALYIVQTFLRLAFAGILAS